VQDRTAALTLIIAVVAGVAALEFGLVVRITRARVVVSFRRWCVVGAAVAVEVVLVSVLLVLFPRPEDYVRAILTLCAGQGLLAVSGMSIWMRYRG
jgi:hypothetical protein